MTELTDRDLYWAGYFRADGCINRYSGSAQFSQRDRQAVEALALYLNLPLSRVRRVDSMRRLPGALSKSEQTQYILRSKDLADFLVPIGVKESVISRQLTDSPHFWRGMIDGDGSISFRASGRLSVGLCGTYLDMESFSNFCYLYIGRKPTVYTSRSIFRVLVDGKRAENLCHQLYVGQYSALQYKRRLAYKAAGIEETTDG